MMDLSKLNLMKMSSESVKIAIGSRFDPPKTPDSRNSNRLYSVPITEKTIVRILDHPLPLHRLYPK